MIAHEHGSEQVGRVCIVGAGVSGLRAAGLLAAAGVDVTIVEARNRVGGRVHQSKLLDQPVDVGPSWIHGTEGNPIVQLANQAQTPTIACNAVYSICDSNGSWLPRRIARKLYEEVWKILELGMIKSEREKALIHDSCSLMDFVRQELETAASGIAELDLDTYRRLILQIVEMWGAFMGDDCGRQSLKNLWLDAGLEGDNLFVLGTYSSIIKRLLDSIEVNATMRLNCEVEAIQCHNGQVTIKAKDGFCDSYKSVIVTTPLGWLKRNQDIFSPPLIPNISNAIQSIGYGNLDRVFIRFPKPFWNDHPNTSNVADDLPFPIESLFLSPDYAPKTNPARWRIEIISFSGMPKPYCQPVIMFFIYGQFGRHVTGLVRGIPYGSKEYYRILDEQFRPYYSKLPNYDSTSADCQPSDILSTDWQGDPLSGFGSYSNLPVDSGDCAEHVHALRTGMADRGIWFAGEHASPLGGLGTVTGAYWSGEEAAKSVARQHQITLSV